MNEDQQNYQTPIGEMIDVHNIAQPTEPQIVTKGFTLSNIQQPAIPQSRPETSPVNNGIATDHVQLPVQENGDE